MPKPASTLSCLRVTVAEFCQFFPVGLDAVIEEKIMKATGVAEVNPMELVSGTILSAFVLLPITQPREQIVTLLEQPPEVTNDDAPASHDRHSVPPQHIPGALADYYTRCCCVRPLVREVS